MYIPVSNFSVARSTEYLYFTTPGRVDSTHKRYLLIILQTLLLSIPTVTTVDIADSLPVNEHQKRAKRYLQVSTLLYCMQADGSFKPSDKDAKKYSEVKGKLL